MPFSVIRYGSVEAVDEIRLGERFSREGVRQTWAELYRAEDPPPS